MGYLADRAKQFFDYERGAKEVMTFFRQGLREVRSLLYPESTHARETDPAMWGNKLPMEIYQDRHGEPDLEAPKPEQSLRKLEQQFEYATASRDEHVLEQPSMERE